MRVLLMDDHLDTLEIYSVLFQGWGHEVRALQQPSLVLSTALEFLPDVAFLDLGMPEIDGFEVARMMRQHPRLERVFLVAMTGHSNQEDRAKEAGIEAYLMKPVDIAKLQSFVEELSGSISRGDSPPQG
jgi:CheY-like chemotaxis protein